MLKLLESTSYSNFEKKLCLFVMLLVSPGRKYPKSMIKYDFMCAIPCFLQKIGPCVFIFGLLLISSLKISDFH